MVRAWILFATLVFSVFFKLYDGWADKVHTFRFHDATLNDQSWWYYRMEHVIHFLQAACLAIKDTTPGRIIYLFIVITFADWVHYEFFYRDETVGFNFVKCVTFGIPITWLELQRLFRQHWRNL